MARPKKITWDVIFQDFKKRHPKLGRDVLRYEAWTYATIMLIFPDRVRMTYNYDTKKVVKLKKQEVDEMIRRSMSGLIR